MNYHEFKEELKTELEGRFGERAEVSFQTIRKMNRVKRESILIGRAKDHVSPVISLEDLYNTYMVTRDLGKCVEEVLRIYRDETLTSQIDVPMTWEEVKDRIQFRLVKKEWNQEMLEQAPYREYLDFAAVFYVQIGQMEEIRAMFTVTREIAELWGVGSKELWEAAWRSFEKEAFSIETMEFVPNDLMEGELQEAGEGLQDGGMVYVMSNQSRNYGARAVLRKDVLQELADEQKSSFYLLPSSVHEWILYKDDGTADVHMMKSIVSEINGDSRIISPEECLSDSIYYYDWEQDEVKIVA